MDSPVWAVTSGPWPFSQLKWTILCWLFSALCAGVCLQVYVSLAASAEVRNERIQNTQIWVGGSGVFGTAIQVTVGLVVAFSAVFAAVYCRLISIDLHLIAANMRFFGEKFLVKSKFIEDFMASLSKK